MDIEISSGNDVDHDDPDLMRRLSNRLEGLNGFSIIHRKGINGNKVGGTRRERMKSLVHAVI